MPVFDTPITTNEQNLPKVLAQQLPVALYLYKDRDSTREETLAQLAKEHAGRLLVARVDVADNPGAHSQYGRPPLPALITLSGGQVKSTAGAARPADLRPHIDYLLGRGPQPAAPRPQPTAAAVPVHVTDQSFQHAVLGSDLPVLVDFWAPWCGPCLSIAPYLDRMAGEFAGRVKIAKLNVDENPHIAGQFGVQAIPTFITFKKGKMIRRQSGADPNAIRVMIQGVLSA